MDFEKLELQYLGLVSIKMGEQSGLSFETACRAVDEDMKNNLLRPVFNFKDPMLRGHGGTGRREGLKSPSLNRGGGSSPSVRTKKGGPMWVALALIVAVFVGILAWCVYQDISHDPHE